MNGASMNPARITSPARDFQVVRSSSGRLRVHLPDPDEQIVGRLRQLPGVTSAEASQVTGNILILYKPRQTSETALLDELRGLCMDLPPIAALPAQADWVPPLTQAAVEVAGPHRLLFQALGWSSIGLAVVGAVTPGIPTAPFVVLGGYFFIRSSPEAHDWLLRSRWFGPFLRDWEERGGVRRSVKYTAVSLMGAGMVVASLLALPAPVFVSIVALEIIGLVVVLRLPVVEDLPAAAAVESEARGR